MPRPRGVMRPATILKLEKIVRYQLLDLDTAAIAEKLEMKPDSVSELMKSKQYREIRDREVAKTYKKVDTIIATRKVNQILEDIAPDAAEALVELLRRKDGVKDETGNLVEGSKLDPVDVRLTATALLDRAGYGPVQRKAIRQRIEMDPKMAEAFARALRESDPLTRAIDVTPIREEGEEDEA